MTSRPPGDAWRPGRNDRNVDLHLIGTLGITPRFTGVHRRDEIGDDAEQRPKGVILRRCG